MKVGITGTRHGITKAQEYALNRMLEELGTRRLHHGACLGADANAVFTACLLNHIPHIVAHPGKRAKGGDNEWLSNEAINVSDEVRPTKTHFARNRDIVDETDVLIALPGNMDPLTAKTKGGTAYTVWYARKKGMRIYVIRPDGSMQTGSDCWLPTVATAKGGEK